MIIHVTGADIKDGKRSDCVRCPIALAIARKIPDYNVSVEEVAATFRLYGGQTHYVDLPDAAQSFIIGFDRSAPVEPFSFRLALPVAMEAGVSEMTT